MHFISEIMNQNAIKSVFVDITKFSDFQWKKADVNRAQGVSRNNLLRNNTECCLLKKHSYILISNMITNWKLPVIYNIRISIWTFLTMRKLYFDCSSIFIIVFINESSNLLSCMYKVFDIVVVYLQILFFDDLVNLSAKTDFSLICIE